MATLFDVGNALKDAISAALYPNGTNNPCAAGVDCKAFVGWPAPAQLDADMRAQLINISIWPRPDERNTNNNMEQWQTIVAPVPTLTLTRNIQQVTVGGTVTLPQIVSLTIQNKAYPYAVQQGDTLATIATALTNLVKVDYPSASSSGAVITLPNSANLQYLRVGAQGTQARELRRQQRTFQITVWANTPGNRETVARFLNATMAPLRFIDLADGTKTRVLYAGDRISDELEKTIVYRYDAMYTVDYSTVETDQTMQIVNPQADSQGSIIQQVP